MWEFSVYLRCLEQCLACSRCLIHTCWMTKCWLLDFDLWPWTLDSYSPTLPIWYHQLDDSLEFQTWTLHPWQRNYTLLTEWDSPLLVLTNLELSSESQNERRLEPLMSLSPNTSSYSKWEPTMCLTILMSSSAFSLDRSILGLWRLMLFQLLPLFFLNSASWTMKENLI